MNPGEGLVQDGVGEPDALDRLWTPHRWAYIGVNREKHNTANMNTGEPHEVVQLTTLWSHRGIFEEVLGEARTLAARAQEGKTTVYSARGLEWAPLGEPRKKRPR